ncbi:MAG: hypothetical protein JWN95_696 [Frankiales bacterium]|nr:hypothetical protein [Frankiales bacterium]
MPLNDDRFSPLSRVITYDQFDHGQAGWLDLRPNFVKPGFGAHSQEVDLIHWGPTMLSSATFAMMGTHGAMSGTYSLKLTTRANSAPIDQPPAPGSMGLAIKRMAQHRRYDKIQLETWLAYTPEGDRPGLGDTDVRAFGCFFDLQTAGNRWMPGVRYLNAVDGQSVKRWQYFSVADGVTDADWSYGQAGWHKVGVDSQWYGRRHADGSSDGFAWLPDGEQSLVSNEADDKINWMYLRLTVDVANRRYLELQCMDRIFDMRALTPTMAPEYKGIGGLVNPVFFVETGADRRAFLFLDSIVVSVD